MTIQQIIHSDIGKCINWMHNIHSNFKINQIHYHLILFALDAIVFTKIGLCQHQTACSDYFAKVIFKTIHLMVTFAKTSVNLNLLPTFPNACLFDSNHCSSSITVTKVLWYGECQHLFQSCRATRTRYKLLVHRFGCYFEIFSRVKNSEKLALKQTNEENLHEGKMDQFN